MNRRTLLIIIGIVAAVVVLVTVFDMILADHPPVAALDAPEMVIPSGTCQIVCTASDRDGDALSYNWSATGGNISGAGAAVNWTAPELPGSYNVTVTVTDGRGEEVTKQIAVEVRVNGAPIISRLMADADWTTPSGTLQLTCTASDPDEDQLLYEWTAASGDISGTGAVVNWTAPQEVGVYNVTVAVRDGHASEDVMFMPLSVNLGTPPVIEDLIVTPKGHIYLRHCTVAGCDYDVWKTREYDIQCIALGTGELVYDWSCTDGEVTGEGSAITWSAPDKILIKATVTVVVSDAAGNRLAKNIVFHVPSCSCGSWGLS
jgi:hypothetical protein